MAAETLAQFANRRVREVAADYSMSMAEVRRVYGTDRWYGEWWDTVRAAASSGEVVTPRVLDALRRHNRYHLLHDWPDCIPRGYVVPEARATPTPLTS